MRASISFAAWGDAPSIYALVAMLRRVTARAGRHARGAAGRDVRQARPEGHLPPGPHGS